MNTKKFAETVLQMNSQEKRQIAISGLENGLKTETKWNDHHKAEIKRLIEFLKSDSNNIEDLTHIKP